MSDLPNKALHELLDEKIKEMGYGDVHFSLQVHAGRAVSVVGDMFEHRTFENDGGIEAMQAFIERFKQVRAEQKTGSLTVTFKTHNGNIKELMVQGQFKQYLEKP